MNIKELQFEAHPDKGNVSALLLKPRGAKSLVVLGHGAGVGMRHANMENISKALANQGIATFRYQFPFMERGRGRDSLQVSVSTVCNAVKCAKKLAPKLNLFAGGHSYGGRMTSHAAATEPLTGVVGLIFFSFPLHMPGRPSNDRASHLVDIKLPMLFLSGTRDTMMTPELFEPILKKISDRAVMHKLDTGDHGYKILKRTRKSKEDIFDEMGRVASEWISAQI